MTSETRRNRTISQWIAEIKQDPVFSPIIDSAPFQRLADISFLGAIDYLPMAASLGKEPRTRLSHSLGVAGLANCIATKRHYSPELRGHLIAAALLHDIGHAPLSHSVESYLKESLGLDHHDIGAMIIDGKPEFSKSLHDHLENNFDLSFIKSLIDRAVPEHDGGDLFAHKINIDTIDGIIRACDCYLDYPNALERLDVAQAAFCSDREDRFSVLEHFWSLKNAVYKHLIHCKFSVLADSFSRSYFEYSRHLFSVEGALEDEENWKIRYADLFRGLSGITRNIDLFARYADTKAVYNGRNYWIDGSAAGDARFQVSVEQKFYSVEGFQ